MKVTKFKNEARDEIEIVFDVKEVEIDHAHTVWVDEFAVTVPVRIESQIHFVFGNDPFATLAEAFRSLYPNCKYEAYFVPSIKDGKGKEMFGETLFPEDGGAAIISISAELKIKDAIEIFAHKLAHVATPNEEHSKAWEDAFEKIFQEYIRLLEEKEKQ